MLIGFVEWCQRQFFIEVAGLDIIHTGLPDLKQNSYGISLEAAVYHMSSSLVWLPLSSQYISTMFNLYSHILLVTYTP